MDIDWMYAFLVRRRSYSLQTQRTENSEIDSLSFSHSGQNMHDIGILASYDPVTLDQACIDLVYAAEDGGSLVERIESRNGLHTLEHAEAIGLGSRSYELVSIDG